LLKAAKTSKHRFNDSRCRLHFQGKNFVNVKTGLVGTSHLGDVTIIFDEELLKVDVKDVAGIVVAIFAPLH
jgi:hypothetical protein